MAMKDDLRILAHTPIFALLDDEALKLIAFSAARGDVAEGRRLFSVGDQAEGAYVLLSGRLRLSGIGSVPPQSVSKGAMVGEMALLVESERPSDAIAEADTDYLLIRRSEFRRLLSEFPKAAEAVQHYLHSKIAATQQDLQRLRRVFDT